jgi:hypothetical protein
MLRVWIDPAFDTPEAQHALELMLLDIGHAHIRSAHVEEADLVYAPVGCAASRDAVHLLADREAWRREPAHWTDLHGARIPAFGDGASGAAADPESIDLVRCVQHLVSGSVEGSDPRTAMGAVRGSTSTMQRVGALREPPVQTLERLLADALAPRHGPGMARWPGGKQWAVWLSHDVDRPLRYGRTAAHSAAASARLVASGRVRHSALLAASAAAALQPTRRRRADDPHFRFAEWRELELSAAIRPTYFFGATSPLSRRGHALDVSYSLRDPLIRTALRNIVDQGWEVGLHSGIRQEPSIAHYRREREALESATGRAITSSRQHYWATHRTHPERNAAAMAAAGFSLDSSLGMSDAIGWRRGTSLPFDVYDRERRRPTGVWEVTPTLMDSATFPAAVPEVASWELAREVVSAARASGGVLVLNWHVESLSGRSHGRAGDLGIELLRQLASDDSMVWLNGDDLSKLWAERRRSLTPEGRLVSAA